MMNDQQRQRLVEQYEEAALTLLMHDYAHEEGIRLAKEFHEAQENGTLPEIPAALDEKCRALIDKSFAKMERKARLKRIGQATVKAAVILFVVLGVMTTTVMSVDALRIPVINFFIEYNDRYSSISIDQIPDTEGLNSHDVEATLESIVPANYDLLFSEIALDGTGVIIYQEKTGPVISLDIYLSNGEMSFDTENAVQKEVVLLSFNALLIEKDGYRFIWTNPEKDLTYSFFADGLAYEDFWKLSCSVAENC